MAFGAILGQRNGVQTVNGVVPDVQGNVQITASSIGALPTNGGTMTGNIIMGNHKITGLPEPNANSDAVPKSFIDPLRNDFIISQGTSNGWNWRKWNSGTAECWKTQIFTEQPLTSWGDIYQTPDGAFPPVRYPFDFIETPICNVNILYERSYSFWLVYEASSSSTDLKQYTTPFYLAKPTPIQLPETKITPPTIGYYTIGRWK